MGSKKDWKTTVTPAQMLKEFSDAWKGRDENYRKYMGKPPKNGKK